MNESICRCNSQPASQSASISPTLTHTSSQRAHIVSLSLSQPTYLCVQCRYLRQVKVSKPTCSQSYTLGAPGFSQPACSYICLLQSLRIFFSHSQCNKTEQDAVYLSLNFPLNTFFIWKQIFMQ